MKGAVSAFVAALAAVAISCSEDGTSVVGPAAAPHGCRTSMHRLVKSTFHGDAARRGWTDVESTLTPDALRAGFGPSWSSPPFDGDEVGGVGYVGRTYASLLYADDLVIHGGLYDGAAASVVFAATSNGWVYAVNAFDTTCDERSLPAGVTLWKTRLGDAAVVPKLDAAPGFAGVALGVLSTPVLDLGASPPRIYVVFQARDASGTIAWNATALDVTSGATIPGWPLRLDRSAMEAANKNGPAYFDDDVTVVSQRAALALSPSGDRVYVGFGGYYDGAVGWLAALDTKTPRVTASFAMARDTLLAPDGTRARHANGGVWSPAGPAIDEEGRVLVSTGNGPPDQAAADTAHAWGNSVLRFSPDLDLLATYSPWDHCARDDGDTDLGGSSPIVLPDLDPAKTSTRRLAAIGGKNGIAYLLDRDHLATDTTARPVCATSWNDSAGDASLLPPDPSPAYCNFLPHPDCTAPAPSSECARGPLLVFGPAGDRADLDHAKARSTPAYFRDHDGRSFLFAVGTTKSALCAVAGVPPSVARLRVVEEGAGPAYLAVDATDHEISLLNAGSPEVSSHDGQDPIVWVVDNGALRTAALLDPKIPGPVLYAVDGTTMQLLFKSAPLHSGGKYVTPLVAHGTVFVGTDRIEAFAPRAR